jgi:uridine phosphorylase
LNDAVINPVKGKNSPITGDIAVMAATSPDVNAILTIISADKSKKINTLMSGIYPALHNRYRFTVAGPFTGAPHAVLLLENLIAWGVKKIIFIGWCGAISKELKTGDIIIPLGAYSEEGTSVHYNSMGQPVLPSGTISAGLIKKFINSGTNVNSSPVWTTDALYRETVEKIEYYQNLGVSGVEMETSAIFSVAGFRGIEAGAVLTISDELSSFEWKPGFGNKKFKQARKKAVELTCEFVRGLNE